MEWLTRLRGKTVGLDAAPLIYFMEKHPAFLPRVRPFFQAMRRGDFVAVTSTLTLTEVLIHPFRQDNIRLAEAYRDILLNANHLRTIPVTAEIAEAASRLRATHKVPTPDAIHLATAMHCGAEFFFSNDEDLPALPGLSVLVLSGLDEIP